MRPEQRRGSPPVVLKWVTEEEEEVVEEEKSLGQGQLLVEAKDLEIAVPVFPLTNLARIGQGHNLHTIGCA